MVFTLCLVLLLPYASYGEEVVDRDWIIQKEYFGLGGLRLEDNMNRAELATSVVRLIGLEAKAKAYKGKSSFKDVDGFQGGWASSYVDISREEGIINGVSDKLFSPGGNVKYIELLTVFMRVLGYRDGIDFISYPQDHYKKALEIGLGNMYVDMNKEVNRQMVLDTMVKTLNMVPNKKDRPLYEILTSTSKDYKEKEKDKDKDIEISIGDIKFNTSIAGLFKGQLKGQNDFTGYKILLLSKSGAIYGSHMVNKAGDFSISGFDIGVLAKYGGYKYELYNGDGKLILQDDLK